MITEWFLSLASSFAVWIADLFPEWEQDSVFAGFAGMMGDLVAGFAGLGVWVDWAILAACVGVQIAVQLAVLGIKLIRAVAAHIPLFGGSGD